MKNFQKMTPQLRNRQRLEVFGRLRMADWIEMPEREFAREIEKIEKDPLFQKLFFGNERMQGIIRRQRWPAGRLSGSFYEVNERLAAKGERVQIEEMVDAQQSAAAKIRAMGRENFERYFLHAEEPLTLAEIAERTRMKPEDVKAIHDFVVEIGTRAEFELPERDPGLMKSYACLARLTVDSGEPGFEFFSPHWARGLYRIRYDQLESWKRDGDLPAGDRRRLPHLLKRIETVNLRQNTLFRILENVTKLQERFLKENKPESKRPMSLRQLAHRLELAPSTISRALSGRSVRLPSNEEVPLITLVPGRRNVVREIMSRWLEAQAPGTDEAFARRLKEEYAIRVSRRTVNAVRNEFRRKKPA